MKKEPDVLEIKAHFQFWRDRYEQTKSVKDLINMQNHLQEYMQLVEQQKANKYFLIEGGKCPLKKQRELSVKRQNSQVSPRINASLKIVEEYMKNSDGRYSTADISKKCSLPYIDVVRSLEKLQISGVVKRNKIKGIRNQTVFWERCDD